MSHPGVAVWELAPEAQCIGWVDDLSWASPTCLQPQQAPNHVSQARGHLLLPSGPRSFFLILSCLLFHSKSLLSLGDRGGKAGTCALQLPTKLPPLTRSILLLERAVSNMLSYISLPGRDLLERTALSRKQNSCPWSSKSVFLTCTPLTSELCQI